MKAATKEAAFTDSYGSPVRAIKDDDAGVAFGTTAVQFTTFHAEGNLGVIELVVTKETHGPISLGDDEVVYLSVGEAQDLIGELQSAIADATTNRLTVACSLCGGQTPADTAHRHQDAWIGECCWGERLRSSE